MRMRTILTCAVLLLAATPAVAVAAATAAPKIASYNVFMLSRNLYPNWGQLQRADLIAQQRVLSGQDVVVIQEGFDNAASDRLKSNLATEYPNQTPVLGRSRSGWDATLGGYSDWTPEDGGVIVASRWPIARKVQYVYRNRCGIETQSNKGFVYVRLTSPDGPVHVVGTHMQAEDTSTCGSNSAKTRAAQRAELKAFLDAQQVPAADPLYVAGDLNVIESSPEYAKMLSDLGAQAPVHTGHPYSWDCKDNSVCRDQYGPEYASEHLDYVLPIAGHPAPSTFLNETRRAKSPEWSVTSWGTTYTYTDYSDHYPVFGSG